MPTDALYHNWFCQIRELRPNKGQVHSLQQVRLIVHGTKVGFGHQLLMVSLANRKQSILIAWSWVSYIHGHITNSIQLALLKHIPGHLPQGIAVLLIGDTEFGAVKVLQQLDQWRW